MKVIAIANQKGGVGKTTTTQHLAAALVEMGYRVLAVDVDPQANLTMASRVRVDDLKHSMYQVLVTRSSKVAEIVMATAHGYDLAPADPDLETAELDVAKNESGWHRRLDRELSALRAKYEWCLIDCPPTLLGLTVNALNAADGLVVPVSPEMWPIKGMQRLNSTIAEVQGENARLHIVCWIPTRVRRRDASHREMLDQATRLFRNIPSTPPIHESPYFSRAARESTTVLVRNPGAQGAVAYRAAATKVVDLLMGSGVGARGVGVEAALAGVRY